MNLLNHYESFQKNLPASKRAEAFDFVRHAGLPTRHQEDWKYTSLKALGEKDFIPATNTKLSDAEKTLLRAQLPQFFVNLVFVNGILDGDLSSNLPNDVELKNADVTTETYKDSLQALNALYTPQAYSVKVSANADVKTPIHFLFWNTGGKTLSSPLLRVEAGNGARVRFVESHTGPEGQEYFSNPVLHLKLKDQSHVAWLKVQEESQAAFHIGRTQIEVGKDCQLENFLFSNGARLGRNTLEVLLQGTGATAQVHGVYATAGSQHIDNNTTIDHLVGHCQTDQLYKGLLDGESRAVFNGKVLIRRLAQKANSNQLNNNLLLSRKAEVDTKPMLQIDADDVKATHGSTVGQLNQEELFYLLSRAIPKSKAIPLLSYGFLSEVIEKITHEETRQWLTKKLDRTFEKLHLVAP